MTKASISAGLSSSILAAMLASPFPASAGTITGHVHLSGPIPKPPTITMTADPACDRLAPHGRPAEVVVAGPDGSLANVFVYVKGGFPKKFEIPPPTGADAKLDQKSCMFVPHAIGVRVGQEVTIHNSDETMHAVAARSIVNAPFNEATPGTGAELRKVFQRPEVAVKLKCDIHPWMAAYIGVFDHPYFAVTGADGSFTITGLPESDYTIEAWHESLGSQIVKVELEDDDATVTTDFTFVGN